MKRRNSKLSLMTSLQIEVAVSGYLRYFVNMIIPNVTSVFDLHECDLLIITNAGNSFEVEIKTSKADILADKKKTHEHLHPKIKRLYFACPESLKKFALKHIPKRAGLIIAANDFSCYTARRAKNNPNTEPWSQEEQIYLGRLASRRIWRLKRKMLLTQQQANDARWMK